MNKIFFSFFLGVLCLSSLSAQGDNLKIVCGNDKVRVAVTARRTDPLSSATVSSVAVNGQPSDFRKAEANGQEFKIIGFGFRGYESIVIQLSSCHDGQSVAGNANYHYYDASSPMNPMRDLNVGCVCSAM